jgi:penicillin-binding protein 1A
MIQMLRQVIVSGTGARAKIGGYDLAGKTGTTSDYKDAWFVGFTGGFTAAVWVGKDDNTSMKKVTGGGAPTEIWRDFMVAALPRLAAKGIPGSEAPPNPDDAVGDMLDQPPGMDAEAPPSDGEAPQAAPETPAKSDGTPL